MAVYNSKYDELSFYVDGELHSFRNGRFVTEDKNTIKVLDTLADAVKVDDPADDSANKKAKPKEKRTTSRNQSESKSK